VVKTESNLWKKWPLQDTMAWTWYPHSASLTQERVTQCPLLKVHDWSWTPESKPATLSWQKHAAHRVQLNKTKTSKWQATCSRHRKHFDKFFYKMWNYSRMLERDALSFWSDNNWLDFVSWLKTPLWARLCSPQVVFDEPISGLEARPRLASENNNKNPINPETSNKQHFPWRLTDVLSWHFPSGFTHQKSVLITSISLHRKENSGLNHR